jgi:N-acetylmuramoyl-L-alanine amidase
MGGIWLRSLPDVLRNAGLAYGLWPGWENRARSTGGYDAVLGIGVHHDAGAQGSSLDSRCRYAWENSPDRPIGAMWLHDDGFIMIGAAGATNTQGKGGPRQCSKGTIPLDAGNKYTISIEASNNGVGEVWTDIQLFNYVVLCAALGDAYDMTAGDAFAHFEWTDRKIDPAGQSWYASGGNKWDMNQFRSDVFNASNPTEPPPPPDQGDDDVLINLITHNNEKAVFAQYSGGYKVWVPNQSVLDVLKFSSGITKVSAFSSTWFVAAGPMLPGSPIPYPCDDYGRQD